MKPSFLTRSSVVLGMVVMAAWIGPTRADDSRATTRPATGQAEALAMLRPLVGNWRADAKWSAGDHLRAKASYDWGVGEQVLHGKSFVVDPAGNAKHVFDTVIFYHPHQRSLRFISVSVGGGLYEGTVTGTARELKFEWTSYLKDQSTNYRQSISCSEDGERYHWTVWQESPDGEWKQLIDADYLREGSTAEKEGGASN